MKKRTKRKASGTKLKLHPAVRSGLLTLLLTLVGALLGGQALLQGWLPEGATPYLAAGIVFLAVWLGSLPASKQGKLPAAYLNAAVLLILALICKLAVWPRLPFANWMVPLAAVLGATCAGLLSARKKRVRR